MKYIFLQIDGACNKNILKIPVSLNEKMIIEIDVRRHRPTSQTVRKGNESLQYLKIG